MASYTTTMNMSFHEEDTYCSDLGQSDSDEEYETTGACYMQDGVSAYDLDFVNPAGSFGSHGMKFNDASNSGFRGPLQLASDISKFETMKEMVQWYADTVARESREEDEIRIAKEATMKEELAVLMASLPRMSKAFAEKKEKARLLREKVYAANAGTVARAIRKAKMARPSTNAFGHRRNGGKRKKTFAATSDEVMAKRRHDSRQKRKAEKAEQAIESALLQAKTATETPAPVVKVEVEMTPEEIEEAADQRALHKVIVAGQDEREAKETAEREAKVEAAHQENLRVAAIKAAEVAEAATWTKKKSSKKSSKKVTPLVIKMGAASAKPTRMVAVSKIDTAEALKVTRFGTQMCRSVAKGTRCLHGTKCRFVHDPALLKKSVCVYAAECKIVKFVGGVWVNKAGKKKCVHHHPDETKENHQARLDAPLVSRAEARAAFYAKTPTFTAPVVITVPVSTPKKSVWAPAPVVITAPVVTSTPKKSAWAPALVVITAPVEVEAKIEETVLRVPQEMAAVALLSAMKSGRKNIRIVIVELGTKPTKKWSTKKQTSPVTLSAVMAEQKVTESQRAVTEEKANVAEAKKAAIALRRRQRKKKQRTHRNSGKKDEKKAVVKNVKNADGWTTVKPGSKGSARKVDIAPPQTPENFWGKLVE